MILEALQMAGVVVGALAAGIVLLTIVGRVVARLVVKEYFKQKEKRRGSDDNVG